VNTTGDVDKGKVGIFFEWLKPCLILLFNKSNNTVYRIKNTEIMYRWSNDTTASKAILSSNTRNLISLK